jgi:hypothetical protein
LNRIELITLRIQLELPEENVNELKVLMAEAHIATYKELFSNALSLLHWTVKEVKNGRIIASMDEAAMKYKELVIPALQTVAKPAPTPNREEFAVGLAEQLQARR